MALDQQQAAQVLQQAGVNVFNLKLDASGVSGQVTSQADATKAIDALTAINGAPLASNLQVVGGGSGGAQSYTVKSGDNLRKIAQHFYGDEMKWHAIRDANRDVLPDPDKIQAGMTLQIPAAS